MAEFFPLPADNDQPLRPYEAERAWHVVNQAEIDTREFLKLAPSERPDVLVTSPSAQILFDLFADYYKYTPTEEEQKAAQNS